MKKVVDVTHKAIALVGSAVLLVMLGAMPLQAAQIVTYDFDGSPGSLVATTVDPGATASDVNFTGSALSQSAVVPDVLAVNVAAAAVDFATAVSSNSYFQFSVTPSAGGSLDLSELSFDGGSAFSNLPNNGWVVRSSIDGYASDLSTSSLSTAFPTMFAYTVPLGVGFQGLTTETTFRIYAFKDIGNDPSAAYDNLVVSGTASQPVPEPSTFALGCIAICGCGYIRYRRRLRSAR